MTTHELIQRLKDAATITRPDSPCLMVPRTYNRVNEPLSWSAEIYPRDILDLLDLIPKEKAKRV